MSEQDKPGQTPDADANGTVPTQSTADLSEISRHAKSVAAIARHLEGGAISKHVESTNRYHEAIRLATGPLHVQLPEMGYLEEIGRQQKALRLAVDPALRFQEMGVLQDFQRHHEALRGLTVATPSSPFLSQLAEMRHLTDAVSCQTELARLAAGPFGELRRTWLFDNDSVINSEFKRISEMVALYEHRFKLPEITEALRLAEMPRMHGIASKLFHDRSDDLRLKLAMESMHSPWLDAQNAAGSVASFMELQGIGHALRSMPAFDDRLADALRGSLGDWRQSIEFPSTISIDAVARSAFYAERGLNPGLTDFPSEAFEESISIAGLKDTLPPLVDSFGVALTEPGEGEEEEGFKRTNRAHNRLLRLEVMVRRFIDMKMKFAFGENWIKHRVPGDMCKKWQDKRQKSLDVGEAERPLLDYADFGEYADIIVRKDNWNEIFKEVFFRAESVRESFQRLYPIRNGTMHSRIITQDDELYIYAETTRILRAIGVV